MNIKFDVNLQRVISVSVTGIAAVLADGIFARFTGLFAPYWQDADKSSLAETVLAWFGQDVLTAIQHGWVLGVLMLPFYLVLFPHQRAVRWIAWISVGLLFGCWNMSAGSYVYHGDWSSLVNAPVGIFGALLAEPIHRVLWYKIGPAQPTRLASTNATGK